MGRIWPICSTKRLQVSRLPLCLSWGWGWLGLFFCFVDLSKDFLLHGGDMGAKAGFRCAPQPGWWKLIRLAPSSPISAWLWGSQDYSTIPGPPWVKRKRWGCLEVSVWTPPAAPSLERAACPKLHPGTRVWRSLLFDSQIHLGVWARQWGQTTGLSFLSDLPLLSLPHVVSSFPLSGIFIETGWRVPWLLFEKNKTVCPWLTSQKVQEGCSVKSGSLSHSCLPVTCFISPEAKVPCVSLSTQV